MHTIVLLFSVLRHPFIKWLSFIPYIFWPSVNQPTDCDLKINSDDIKVYTCKTVNGKFKTLRAEFVLHNTSMEKLRLFIFNVDNYATWQYNMIQAELTQQINENEITYISEVNAPWPVEDRELVMNLKIMPTATNDRMHIEMKSYESAQPVKNGFIRVPFMHGKWAITSNQNNLHVEYTLQIDPGGTIPAWLVNMAMAEGPYVSFINLKKQLEK